MEISLIFRGRVIEQAIVMEQKPEKDLLWIKTNFWGIRNYTNLTG
jgi:hypothetical protein